MNTPNYQLLTGLIGIIEPIRLHGVCTVAYFAIIPGQHWENQQILYH